MLSHRSQVPLNVTISEEIFSDPQYFYFLSTASARELSLENVRSEEFAIR